MASVISKSAITPSFRGRIALIVDGVRPSICLASAPTACTSPLETSTAPTHGPETTMPRPRTYTSVFAVPRSTAMSRAGLIEARKLIPGIQVRFQFNLAERPKSPKWAEIGALRGQLGGELQQRAGRKPDHVGDVSVDPVDERRAEPLHGVAARPAAPLT